MLRFYIRLVLGAIFLIDAVSRGANPVLAVVYTALGIAFLYSASRVWRREKDNM